MYSSDLEFIDEFCDACCVLGSAPTLHQLLSVDRRKSVLVGHILAMLSHVLRTRAENVTVVQDILAQRGLLLFVCFLRKRT